MMVTYTGSVMTDREWDEACQAELRRRRVDAEHAIMPVVCDRTRKLLEQCGMPKQDHCDGNAVACGHCQHTAAAVVGELMRTR